MNLEYYVCVLTFFAIQVTGIEAGKIYSFVCNQLTVSETDVQTVLHCSC